jgi:hypothetical protein
VSYPSESYKNLREKTKRKPMGEKSNKKRTVASVCQNILMICGVITALTGALGGVVETVKNVFDGDEKAAVAEAPVPVPVVASHAPAPAPAPASEGVIIEQRVHGAAGKKVRVSKTIEVGDTAEASAEVGTGASEPPFGDVVTMSVAPEETLGQMWKRLWGWMLGGGLSVISAIMLVGWFVNRKKETEKE